MTARVDAISSVDWSPQVGAPGEVVEDLADIGQCIDIILGTPLGSDPHRPLFGCEAWRWLDAPPALAVPNIVTEVLDALQLWEPRTEIVNVAVIMPAAGQAEVTVIWQRKGSSVQQTQEVAIGR